MPHGRLVFVALQSKPVKPEPVYVFELQQVHAKRFRFLTGAASKQEKDLGVKCEGDQRGEAEMQALFCSVFAVLFSIHPWNSWHLHPWQICACITSWASTTPAELSLNSALNPNCQPQLMSMRTICLPFFSSKSEVRSDTDEVKQNPDLRSLFSADWQQQLTLGSKLLTQHCTPQILVFKIRVAKIRNNGK